MGLATIDSHSQKEHTEIHKALATLVTQRWFKNSILAACVLFLRREILAKYCESKHSARWESSSVMWRITTTKLYHVIIAIKNNNNSIFVTIGTQRLSGEVNQMWFKVKALWLLARKGVAVFSNLAGAKVNVYALYCSWERFSNVKQTKTIVWTFG